MCRKLLCCTLISVVIASHHDENMMPGPPAGPPPVWCNKQAPCYQYVFNVIMDGEQVTRDEHDALTQHFYKAGKNRSQIIEYGRKALEFFEVNQHKL